MYAIPQHINMYYKIKVCLLKAVQTFIISQHNANVCNFKFYQRFRFVPLPPSYLPTGVSEQHAYCSSQRSLLRQIILPTLTEPLFVTNGLEWDKLLFFDANYRWKIQVANAKELIEKSDTAAFRK